MLLRLLLLFTLFLSLCFANNSNYPKTYNRLGTPLYNAAEYFIQYEKISNLEVSIQEYINEVDATMLYGYAADISKDKKKKKTYLKKLRHLQSLYDRLLHSLHVSISKSIKNEEYKLFLELTSYPFDGLFANTHLHNQAITFYTKHKNEKILKCMVLEKNMADEKLSNETQDLFAAEIEHSSYNSTTQKKSKKSVNITTKRVKNTIEVYLHNKNIIMSIKPLKEFVLKAKSIYHYTTLILGSGKSQYGFSWSYTMGSKNAQHDDNYVYRLPYKKGTFHVVSQGYNGKDTHKGSAAYSIDFPMPKGTKIYAARDGIVVKTKSNSDVGGYDKKYASSGNYVRVMHKDGTFATYYHLKYNGVIVKIGEKVSKGEPLGYSGSTGYCSGPHLHFSVLKAKSAGKHETIPTKFRTLKGILENPIRGIYYKAI
ncbi:MAG: M23 family metallopeptidase [Sulfurimonas sp.]|nr:M23 family metallopeptidase [Sulfurimonas sp.]